MADVIRPPTIPRQASASPAGFGQGRTVGEQRVYIHPAAPGFAPLYTVQAESGRCLVPKSLWGPLAPADAQNRVGCGNHCVLARDGRHMVMIDTGCGTKLAPLDRKFHAMEEGDPLVEDLAALGVAPEDIDTVVLTHLHFDHVGGATRFDRQGQLVPTFPKARYLVSRLEWNDATIGGPELQTAYSMDNLLPLAETGQLVLLNGDPAILPGLTAFCTGGHTRGHLAVKFCSAGQTALFIGDLCPTTAHLRRMWCTAYDIYSIETRRHKPELLGEAARRRWLVLWNHDPDVAAGYVACHPKRAFIVEEPRRRL